jgi:hypothetical protein
MQLNPHKYETIPKFERMIKSKMTKSANPPPTIRKISNANNFLTSPRFDSSNRLKITAKIAAQMNPMMPPKRKEVM